MFYLIRATFIAVLLALAALIPRAAHANQPINQGSTIYSYTDNTSCAFPLAVQGETTIQKIFFQDNRSIMFSFHGQGTVSANGDTFKFFYDGHNTAYFDNGVFVGFATSGLQLHVNVPGAGLVIADIGHLVYEPGVGLVLEAGQHDFAAGVPNNYSNLCPYFT
jgi:hypothetical protein